MKKFAVKVRWVVEGDFSYDGNTLEEAERACLAHLNDPKGAFIMPASIEAVPNSCYIHHGSDEKCEAEGATPAVSVLPHNNHICPSCGNDRVNKNEVSCWKCGNKL